MNELVTSASSLATPDEADVVTDFTFFPEPSEDPKLPPRLGPEGIARRRRGLRPKILVAASLAQNAFLQGISRVARDRNWQLVTDMLHTGALPQRWDGDGIIAFAPFHRDVAAYVAETRTPCVTVTMTEESADLPKVQPDYFAIGQMAARHLIRRGCRSFAWSPYLVDLQNRSCLEGFQSVIQPRGYPCNLLPPAHSQLGSGAGNDWRAWRQMVAIHLQSLPIRTGLFAFNDCLSLELVSIAQEAGILVPEDLAIIGVGNESLECDTSPIALTSIDPDFEGLAHRAAELLDALINGENLPSTVHLVPPNGVVARQSTAFSQYDNPRLTHARSFIAENYPDPSLSVSTVAAEIGVSRRQLEREFRGSIRCAVREYIESTRMTEASRLLVQEPETKISAIAEMVGISAAGNFFRIFRKRFGMTPAAYRQKHVLKHDP